RPLLAPHSAVQRVPELMGEDSKCLPVGVAVMGFPRDSDGAERITGRLQLCPQARVSVVGGWPCPRTSHARGDEKFRRFRIGQATRTVFCAREEAPIAPVLRAKRDRAVA